MRELEAAISGRFHHDGNPILSWMIATLSPVKMPTATYYAKTNAKKIDGGVALLMGISRAMVLVHTGGSMTNIWTI